jgi:hypothetical protein
MCDDMFDTVLTFSDPIFTPKVVDKITKNEKKNEKSHEKNKKKDVNLDINKNINFLEGKDLKELNEVEGEEKEVVKQVHIVYTYVKEVDNIQACVYLYVYTCV